MQRNRVLSALMAFTLVTVPVPSFAEYNGPLLYQLAADSPFSSTNFVWFSLENFEDGALNVPGVSASIGTVLGPEQFRDSVDADDGAIDGAGQGGHSFYLNETNVLFTFDADAPGGLPTHAGIVWTDAGIASPTFGFGSVQFEAFDATNGSLGVWGPFEAGDGLATGQTAEDRFFGVVHMGGIHAISLTTLNSADWEVDHLQYGRYDVPDVCPLLGIQLMDTNVVLSWPQWGSNAVLQACEVLTNGTTWSPAPGTPTLVGDSYFMTNAITASVQFFRLQCQ